MSAPLNQKTIQNPPFNVPFTDDEGFVSKPWSIWIRQSFSRMGGNDALSNTELASTVSGQTTTIATIQSQVTALEGASFGLGVGPTL